MPKISSRVVRTQWLAVVFAAAMVLAPWACSKTPEPPPPPTPAPTPAPPPPPSTPPASTPPPSPTATTSTPKPPAVQQPPPKPAEPVLAKNADVVVKDMADPRPVAVRVGQTVGILSYNSREVWQVDVDED